EFRRVLFRSDGTRARAGTLRASSGRRGSRAARSRSRVGPWRAREPRTAPRRRLRGRGNGCERTSEASWELVADEMPVREGPFACHDERAWGVGAWGGGPTTAQPTV